MFITIKLQHNENSERWMNYEADNWLNKTNSEIRRCSANLDLMIFNCLPSKTLPDTWSLNLICYFYKSYNEKTVIKLYIKEKYK